MIPVKPLCRVASLLMASLFLAACTTALKRAQTLMDNGLYSEAATQYESILKRNPRDEAALIGLRSARTGIIDRKLIDVRLSRLAGGRAQALDLLLEVVGLERKWELPPAGKIAFTQEEETGLAFVTLRETIDQALSDGKPLRSEFLLTRYQPIFQGDHQPKLQALETAIRKKGNAVCGELRKEKSQGKPHFARLVSAFCTHWGVETAELAPPTTDGDVPYFSGLVPTGEVAGLSTERRSAVIEAMQKGFTRTAWYQASSTTPLPVSLSGRYSESRNREKLSLTHTYQVEVPHTEYVEVKKERQVPFTQVQHITDTQAPGGIRIVHSNEMKTEHYTTMEPRTTLRKEDRFYPYSGWLHRQELTLEVGSRFSVANRPVEVSLSDSSKSEGIEHHEHQPKIGLSPRKPALQEPAAWLQTQSAKLTQALETRAAQAWKELYCTPMNGGSTPVIGNHIERCLRQPMAEPPAFAENWYQATFGLGVKDASKLLGR